MGSVAKIWTATLIVQLVHEGLLDPDRLVRDAPPEFLLFVEADADDSDTIADVDEAVTCTGSTTLGPRSGSERQLLGET
jgi:hypothetical protein